MTKSLEQIQQENRKFILEAIHGCSYEEALKKELGVGCKVKIKRFMSTQNFNEEIFIIDNYCEFSTENLFRTINLPHHNEIIKIIGKPLTLSRVLLASIKSEKCMDCFEHKNNKYCSSEWHIDREENSSRIRDFILDNWKNLELEALEEQAEEVQTKINELFNN